MKSRATFILGAGVSSVYGYPLGLALVEQIKLLTQTHLVRESHREHNDKICSATGFTLDQIIGFNNALTKADPFSIDDFLQNNREYSEIGKFYITKYIAEAEDEAFLYESKKSGLSVYKLLFNKLLRIPKIDPGQLSFVTFNYDISLECYIQNYLRFGLGLSGNKLTELQSKITIIHIHGKIGNIKSGENQDGRKYGALRTYDESSFKTIHELSRGIEIVHESSTKNSSYNEANDLITNSDYIFFLGFGYHPLSIKRSGLEFAALNYLKLALHGTAMGLSEAEIDVIRSGIPRIVLGKNSEDAVAFLRNNSAFNSNLI